MDKWGYNYLIEYKTFREMEKLLVTSNFSFIHNVFKSCLSLMHQNKYLWSKGLRAIGEIHGPLCFLFASVAHNRENVLVLVIYSSPEHNMLRVSYCDRSMSRVRPRVLKLLKKSSPLKPANRLQ